ncbi:MAG: vitamin B12 dependent-methionine synthase activation domain-containing protein [Clostridia bacterium]|nr:vitamin B12 dependent-methionine synthase activation domain-containing protein [Clostridia bacterium]
MEIDKKEVLRYMGHKSPEVPQNIDKEIDRVIEMFKTVTPKSVTIILPLEILENGVKIGGISVNSIDLKKHLDGFEEVMVIAATLGVEADTIIRKCALIGTVNLSAAQAAGTAMIESYLDTFGTHRFSPGYGDWDICDQQKIINLLDATKKIGITLTESMMMIPTKSVTAVMGIGKEQNSCHSCENCDKKDCEFRK